MTFTRALIVIWLVVAALAVAGVGGARGQEHHDQHHAFYQNWHNLNDQGCCNDQDCGELADADERSAGGVIEVRVEGEWCEVKPWMYLKTGNAPNWSTSHVCVLVNSRHSPRPVCERLICYQPKPSF